MGPFLLGRPLEDRAPCATYLAWHTALQREVEVQLVEKRKFGEDPARLLRFLSEATCAAQIVHPNVQRLLEIGEERDDYFLVLELIEGSPIDPLVLRESARLPVQLGLSRLREAASALALSSSLGVSHRDLKPANLWMTKEGALKIKGYGLAQLLEGAELIGSGASSQSGGTALYRSPELWLGDPKITPATDIYSLGCVFYHLFSGDAPYRAFDLVGCFQEHCLAPVPDLRSASPDQDPGLAELLFSCMAKKPEARPTAAELARILDQRIAGPQRPQASRAPAAEAEDKPRRLATSRRATTISRRASVEGGAASYPEIFSMAGHPFSDDAPPSSFWEAGPHKKTQESHHGPGSR